MPMAVADAHLVAWAEKVRATFYGTHSALFASIWRCPLRDRLMLGKCCRDVDAALGVTPDVCHNSLALPVVAWLGFVAPLDRAHDRLASQNVG